MLFADKLCFLMELTATSSKQLAQVLNVDPSLISRYRKGSRRVSQGSEYIPLMASYFAARCTGNYQKMAIAEMTGCAVSESESSLCEAMTVWLLSDKSIDEYRAVALLDLFEKPKERYIKLMCFEELLPVNDPDWGEYRSFSGPDAKFRACRFFASLCVENGSPKALKLLTQGKPDWMRFERSFGDEIDSFLASIIDSGAAITRIMPDISNLTMAQESVRRWLPLYCSGKVSTYYYKGLKDDLFYHALYMVPGKVAMYCCSVGSGYGNGPVLVTRNRQLLDSFEELFNSYLSVCSPATSLYRFFIDDEKINEVFSNFFEWQEDCICSYNTLPISTTPGLVFADREGVVETSITKNLEQTCKKRREYVIELTKNFSFTETFPLDSFEDIIAGRVPCMAKSILYSQTKCYTPEEYLEHLNGILELLDSCPNYNVFLKNRSSATANVYIKRGHKIIIILNNKPYSICCMSYAMLVDALWEYESREVRDARQDALYRSKVIFELSRLALKLRDYIDLNK